MQAPTITLGPRLGNTGSLAGNPRVLHVTNFTQAMPHSHQSPITNETELVNFFLEWLHTADDDFRTDIVSIHIRIHIIDVDTTFEAG